jgi:hypothetical protein
MTTRMAQPELNWLRAVSGMTPEIERELGELIEYQDYVIETHGSDSISARPIPLSKPKELNLTNPASLFTVQPFAADLRIPADTTCLVVSDCLRMGYEAVLMVCEHIQAIPQRICFQEEVVVYCSWPDSPMSAIRVSGNASRVGLSQDETQRAVHVTMTLAEALKMILASQWTADGSRVRQGELPIYIVVARHKFDLIRKTHTCQLTVYNVTPKLFLQAVGLEEKVEVAGPPI